MQTIDAKVSIGILAALAALVSGCASFASMNQEEQTRALLERFGPECGMPPQVLTDRKFTLPAAQTRAITDCVKSRGQASGYLKTPES